MWNSNFCTIAQNGYIVETTLDGDKSWQSVVCSFCSFCWQHKNNTLVPYKCCFSFLAIMKARMKFFFSDVFRYMFRWSISDFYFFLEVYADDVEPKQQATIWHLLATKAKWGKKHQKVLFFQKKKLLFWENRRCYRKKRSAEF